MQLHLDSVRTDSLSVPGLVLRLGLHALLGPNGSGKSSLLRIIAGSVHFNGDVHLIRDGKGWRHPKLKRRLGYAPQEMILYEEMLGIEYLVYIARLKQIPETWITNRIAELCREYHCSSWIDDKISEISTGQRKLLLMLQALLADIAANPPMIAFSVVRLFHNQLFNERRCKHVLSLINL